MRPTLEYIQQRFEHFNRLCFGGQLPNVELRLSNARTFMGQLRYVRKRNIFGQTKIQNLVLSISTRYDEPEQMVEDTLLHEMIHLYILVNRLRDSSTHGPLFRSLMQDINHRFGRHITISHRRSKTEEAQNLQRRRHYICISTLTDGRTGITLAMPSSIFRLWRDIEAFSAVRGTKWYVSEDPYFNRFRRSRTIKIYAANPQELAEHLASAHELCNENGRIYAVRK